MPCTYDESKYERDERLFKEYAQKTTAILCKVCEMADNGQIKFADGAAATEFKGLTQLWWATHQEEDRKREAKEKADKQKKIKEAEDTLTRALAQLEKIKKDNS